VNHALCTCDHQSRQAPRRTGNQLDRFDDLLTESRNLGFRLRLQSGETTFQRATMRDTGKAELVAQTSIFLKQSVQLQALEGAQSNGDDRQQ